MRDTLRELDDQRFRIRATVSRMGVRATVLLVNGIAVDTGAPLFDHVWMKTGVWARVPWGNDWRSMRPDDVIEFDGRSGSYLKGYMGQRADIHRPVELDWRLMRPTRLVLVHDSLSAPSGR